jgi:hypothetical protein
MTDEVLGLEADSLPYGSLTPHPSFKFFLEFEIHLPPPGKAYKSLNKAG